MSVALAVLVGAVASVRMLRLPWWWLLFPPLVECVLSANVQGLLIPLIIGRAGALAAFLKLYALVPLVLLGRWRAVATTAVALVVTIPVLPWSTFLADAGGITSRLADQTNYALPTIWLVLLAPLAVAALIVVGRERAAWLAVPAMWPSPQYYYASLVMGTGSVIAASVAAIPAPGSALLASLVLALVVFLERRRAHDSTVPASAGPSGR
jgi:hypothetical protein